MGRRRPELSPPVRFFLRNLVNLMGSSMKYRVSRKDLLAFSDTLLGSGD